MPNFISRTLARATAVSAPRGPHRAAGGSYLPSTAPPSRRTACVPSRTAAVRLPAHRSPYGLDTPLDGEEVALIRPYLLAYKERTRQQQWRRALPPTLDNTNSTPLRAPAMGAAR